MSARGAMTMRALVERSAAQPTDPWGRQEPPIFAAVGSPVPCRAWSTARREIRDDGKEVVLEDLRATIPAGADVAEGDRLTITDRRGAVLYNGPVAVETISRRSQSGSATGHLELMLTRHTGAA